MYPFAFKKSVILLSFVIFSNKINFGLCVLKSIPCRHFNSPPSMSIFRISMFFTLFSSFCNNEFNVRWLTVIFVIILLSHLNILEISSLNSIAENPAVHPFDSTTLNSI